MTTLEKVLTAIVVLEALGFTEPIWGPYVANVPLLGQAVTAWHTAVGSAKTAVSSIAPSPGY